MPAGRAILTRPFFLPPKKACAADRARGKEQRTAKGTAEEEKSKEKKRGICHGYPRDDMAYGGEKKKGGTTYIYTRSAEKLYVSLRKREGNLLLPLEQQGFL
nr:hypothetical protein [Pandoravirus massiliensis]